VKYNVLVYKRTAEIDINANSAFEAEKQVKEMLPEDKDFILKIKAVKPKLVVLLSKVGIMER
jgi:hypothetical protein